MKVKRNITIDKKLDDKLKMSPEINASALCNKFLWEYVEKTENDA